MSPLRVGLLGCGGIGARHAGAVAALPDALELVACCGRDAERTAKFASVHRAKPFVQFERMLGESRLDLLIVALPPYAHEGEVERAAAAGIHLLVEKPLALDEATAARMVEAAEAAGIIAANGFMYRFGDSVSAWQQSDTGPVGLFTASYACNALHAPWWREKSKSGGQMVEQAIHLVDLVRLFMGDPDFVYARSANLFHRETPGYDVEDISAVIFGWDDGRLATLNANNIAVPGRWQKGWSLYAEKMTGHFTGWNDAILTATNLEPPSERTICGTTDPFVAQLSDLAEAIRDGRQPRCPLADGAATLALALAARRSADERREIRLADAL